MEVLVAFLIPIVLSLAFLALPGGDRLRRSQPRDPVCQQQTVDVLAIYNDICGRPDRADDV
jgi:hypothetical protein